MSDSLPYPHPLTASYSNLSVLDTDVQLLNGVGPRRWRREHFLVIPFSPQAGSSLIDMASDQLDALLADLRARLEILYGERLERIILYGSHARGDATEESDVDVLTVLSGDVRQAEEIFRTSNLTFDVGMKHDALVSVYAASAQAFREKPYGFLRNVRAEGIPV